MSNCVFIYYLVRRLSQGMYKKVTYIRMLKFMIQKRKYLFIPMKVQLITISSVIPYISKIDSTSSSLKKKKKKGASRERKKEGKRGIESAKAKEKEMEKRRRRKMEKRKRD